MGIAQLSAYYANCQFARLQKMQNKAARLITRTPALEHIKPILKDLHWLPVESRIKYKTLLFMYKCMHNKAPPYISSLLHDYNPVRTLRSSSEQNLIVPKIKSKYGSRAFSANAPKPWNSLPLQIKQAKSVCGFRKMLKTFLFNKSF